MRLAANRFMLCLLLLGVGGIASSKPAPLSIDELRTRHFSTKLEFVRKLADGENYTACLVSYSSSGLKVHAMIATPKSPKPARGYPVLIANHGHHPDPPQYGITADGVDARPGDYYRMIPVLFAAAGFLVVMPDYRGHNNSEGLEYTRGMLESSYYTEDVVALLSGLADIDDADLDNVFMWGHSMGGEVALRTLLVTDRIRGASMWSSVGGDIWDQAYYYSRYGDILAPDGSSIPKAVIDRLRLDIAALDGPFDPSSVEPLKHLAYLKSPLIIHHAIGDQGAAYKWSERLAKELYLRGSPYEFFSYPGDDHLFGEQQMQQAAARDIAFFRSLLADAARHSAKSGR
jgi:dipeptidyl aminopeptidase/acylaminoacyl peptidase